MRAVRRHTHAQSGRRVVVALLRAHADGRKHRHAQRRAAANVGLTPSRRAPRGQLVRPRVQHIELRLHLCRSPQCRRRAAGVDVPSALTERAEPRHPGLARLHRAVHNKTRNGVVLDGGRRVRETRQGGCLHRARRVLQRRHVEHHDRQLRGARRIDDIAGAAPRQLSARRCARRGRCPGGWPRPLRRPLRTGRHEAALALGRCLPRQRTVLQKLRPRRLPYAYGKC